MEIRSEMMLGAGRGVQGRKGRSSKEVLWGPGHERDRIQGTQDDSREMEGRVGIKYLLMSITQGEKVVTHTPPHTHAHTQFTYLLNWELQ